MGLLDKITKRAVDRAVDKAVNKTVDKVVTKTVDKAVDAAFSKKENNATNPDNMKNEETVKSELIKCPKCGIDVPKGSVFCPSCGEKLVVATCEEECKEENNDENVIIKEEMKEDKKSTDKEESKIITWFKKKNDTKDTTAEYDKNEIEATKILCVFAYLFWLLLVPLLGAKQSKFARFHSNQGLILAILETIFIIAKVILTALFGNVVVLGTLISIIFWLFGIVILIIGLVGIVNAINGKAKELPVIGKFKILKIKEKENEK